MNTLIKLLTDDDGTEIDEPKWCLVDSRDGDAPRVLCCGSAYGYGESSATYETKKVARGGIECKTCIGIIKAYKKVRL